MEFKQLIKTGELDTVENDAAIVFKGDTPYVLVVMSSGLSDTSKARQDIVSISKIVYGDGAGRFFIKSTSIFKK